MILNIPPCELEYYRFILRAVGVFIATFVISGILYGVMSLWERRHSMRRKLYDKNTPTPDEIRQAYDKGYQEGVNEGYTRGMKAVINLLIQFLTEIKP